MRKDRVIILVLVFLLVLAASYIGFSKYNDWKQERELGLYQQGAQYGYEQAIIQVVQQAVTCEPVPLKVGNDTISMIAVDCLQVPTQPLEVGE